MFCSWGGIITCISASTHFVHLSRSYQRFRTFAIITAVSINTLVITITCFTYNDHGLTNVVSGFLDYDCHSSDKKVSLAELRGMTATVDS